MAISSKLLNDGESVVVSTRTHWKALVVPALTLILVVAAAAFLNTLTSANAAVIAIWAVAAVAIVWLTLLPFLRWLTATYTITSRRLISRRGIITRTGHDIPLNRISDVSYERDLLDRLLGSGTLVISDASAQAPVSLSDIPSVEQVQLKLSDLLYGNPGRRDDDGT